MPDIMKPESKLRKLKNRLFEATQDLENIYEQHYPSARIEYLHEQMINCMLNHAKALEYHYRDDVQHQRKNHKEWRAVDRFIKKYSEFLFPENAPYGTLVLKQELATKTVYKVKRQMNPMDNFV